MREKGQHRTEFKFISNGRPKVTIFLRTQKYYYLYPNILSVLGSITHPKKDFLINNLNFEIKRLRNIIILFH